MYRHAKRPAEQIEILAEVNNCSANEIKAVLIKNGIKVIEEAKLKPKRSRVRAKKWTVDDLVQLLYLEANGMSTIKLAEHFGRTEIAIRDIKSKIRTRQTETARVALDTYNRQRRGNTA
jgi:hypothetical protein